jgi:polysaccharide export outer membrane protein
MTPTTGRLIFAAIATLSIGACGGPPGPVATAPTVQQLAELPTPQPSDFTRPANAYYIGPSDRLTIDVFGVPELVREVQVDAAGRLAFPLIGVIDASGMTPGELAVEIQDRLRGNYVRDPQVTVNLKETTNQLVTVDGQVNRPGMYPVTGRMTLIRAVAAAGSTGEFARLDDVVVMREVGGQTYLGLYNLGAIRRGNYEDPEIFPNDVVVVGDSKQRRLFRDLLQVVPLLSSPLVLLLNNNN